MATSHGRYTVTVEEGGEVVLQFEGYAGNPSDALRQAIAQRETEVVAEISRRRIENVMGYDGE